ncbi:MAG: YegS/Rv2252/BmrU family lipid kinase [Verrucomicrobiota bacterium]
MKACFILNPCSGRNRRRPWLAPFLREFIAARGLDATVVTTERPGHATALAHAALAAGCDRVIAVGGDGTMNETAQALLRSPAALGLVPCGSGNGLARHLRIPTRLRPALALAADPAARVAAIDTGTANGHPFFNAMGCGFDAEVSARFNQLARRGLPAYARTGLAAFLARQSAPIVIHGAGRPVSLDTLLVAVANSDEYGNGARIAPGARVDDGQLDLVAIRPVGWVDATALIARLFLGTLDRSPRVLRLQGARFLLERAAPGLIHTDGETHPTGAALEILVQPRTLRLLVPAAGPSGHCHVLRDNDGHAAEGKTGPGELPVGRPTSP